MHQHPYELSPYQARLEATLAQMAKTHPQGAWLVLDSQSPGKPDSNFRYLTGKAIEGAMALLRTDDQGQGSTLLFYRPIDAKTRLWEGADCELDELLELGFDEVVSSEFFDTLMRDFVKSMPKNCALFCNNCSREQWLLDNGRGCFQAPRSPNELMGRLRVVKDPLELVLLGRAARIAKQAHAHVAEILKPGLYEYELQAEMECWFRKAEGCPPAYDSIVAGGANGLTLHYRKNDQMLKAGELVLIDAGCRLQGYCSDITRTWAISKEPTKAQQRLLNWVQLAQAQAIAQCRPGILFSTVHKTACEVLTQGLLEEGLLKGSLNELLSQQAYKRYYPHGTSHWLGLDVHDCGPYGPDVVLEDGMVLTVEPGLYIGAQADVPLAYQNIAIRWEDDVVVREVPKILGES